MSDRTLAERLIRRLQAEAAAQPGARLAAACAPAVAAAAEPLARLLAEQIGARFSITADAGAARASGWKWGARMSAPKCPICGKPVEAEYRPFCSRRCADVDLQRWLTGRYAVPAAEDRGRLRQTPDDED